MGEGIDRHWGVGEERMTQLSRQRSVTTGGSTEAGEGQVTAGGPTDAIAESFPAPPTESAEVYGHPSSLTV